LEPPIRTVRGFQVVLDSDLATIYGVTTSALNQAAKRNRRRFPKDFLFQTTAAEFADLKSQSVTSSPVHGGRRTRPWVFTEHGAIMAASLLDSTRAIEMSIFVVRAFVRLRDAARLHADLAARLTELERTVAGHDEHLREMFAALRALLEPSRQARKRIGFESPAGEKR
jgi:hypothetical protein